MDMGQALNNSNQTIDQQELNKALIEAAKLGKVDIINLLIQQGANINGTDHIGCTALIHAARGGHLKAVHLLLQHNADVNAIDHYGRTALILTFTDEFANSATLYDDKNPHTYYPYLNYQRIIELLIEYGADINLAETVYGYPPLMLAAHDNLIDIVNLLIKHGANIHTTNNQNETALIIARKKHHNTVGYRLLWEMTPNQRKEYANQIISNYDHFFWFEQALKTNANKLFDIVMPALHIGSNSPLLGGKFDISIWHKIELLTQDFPAWYQDCIPQHLNLALNLAKKYHSAKFRDAFSYLAHPIPEPSNFSRLCSFATNSLSSIGNTCFNTAKPYLPSFISNRMPIEGTENNIQKMEIDGIDEAENRTDNKRKHDDKNHQEGPEKKRFKDS